MEESLSGQGELPVVVPDDAAVPGALQQEEFSAAGEMSSVTQPGELGPFAPHGGTGQWPWFPWLIPAAGGWGSAPWGITHTYPGGLMGPMPGVGPNTQGVAEQVWQGVVPASGGLGMTPMQAAGWYPRGVLPTPQHSPYGAVGLPLGDHLLPATKEKILKGEYVDIFSLLFREPEVKHKEGESCKDHAVTKRKPVEKSWNNWLSGFTIYMGVVIPAQPARALALVKYMDIIHRAVSDFAGNAWVRYDENFRMRAALDPSMPWDAPHLELWVLIMSPTRPVDGDRSDSGHLLSKAVALFSPAIAGQP
ncbi:uncharacterized protein LOC128347977 isoform X2 [Hemicordylus capensis]|uniref:uncharacterized protein LOC128347977 isoform X2 n=1 Tax=Hemicordylus capensis TaxID=884348 RepID=UPI0023039E3A|nr:uncharacterized protein LOC128347977 isoform X2 [Hemicordylus capensis]